MNGPPAVGAPAPPLRLRTLQGATFDLAARRERIALVSFLRHAG